MTRACDLKCRHCRANAQRHCHPDELSPGDARRLVDQLLEFPKPPLLVLTGGDPIKRPDVFDVVDYAVQRGLKVAMTPSATPLVTFDAIQRLKAAGLHRLAVSLDGADAATHDDFRHVAGSFDRTLEIIKDAHMVGLAVQVNTTVVRGNFHQIDQIAELLGTMNIVLWSVFFLIPTGRAVARLRISAEECEATFGKLWAQSQRQPYMIKTTEAPHYRRFLVQQQQHPGRVTGTVGTNDGRGIMFVSHIGEIYPSGFLPICTGRFPLDSVVRTYQEASLFIALRDPNQLKGKCGACEFRQLCGGSRSRDFALTGDPLASDPDCSYVPASWIGETFEAAR
ncbi:MAG TPA: radical SAM protein [Tepidisphaeraceae bacterium]|nr:radical SAM protein [Tepidisphaeraceae bacterium]